MKTGTPNPRYELIVLGLFGILLAYFMPEITGKLVGFEGIQASSGVTTDMTNVVMIISRVCCAIYSFYLVVIGMKRRTQL